ncbi:MAG TPA: hypothetical protein VN673_10895, partial [Clostridia bacterium]|nr:hypothetical protein [Clostridia bacterium]
KVSGPGTVTFANPTLPKTTATFSTGGSYVLRFSASDGTLAGTDELSVTVLSQPLAITSVAVTQNPDLFRLRFPAAMGLAYSVQYTDSLAGGSWLTLTNVPALGQSQTIEVVDPAVTNAAPRFYRVVQQP